MDVIKSKYSYDDIQHVAQLINNLKNDEDYHTIFDILMSDKNNNAHPMVNSNGVFLNLSIVSDSTLDKINKFINKINIKRKSEIDVDVDVIPSAQLQQKDDRMYKLSNYEKNLLKQRQLKKVLNQYSDYEVLKFSDKNTKSVSTRKNNDPVSSKRNVKTKKIKEKSNNI